MQILKRELERTFKNLRLLRTRREFCKISRRLERQVLKGSNGSNGSRVWQQTVATVQTAPFLSFPSYLASQVKKMTKIRFLYWKSIRRVRRESRLGALLQTDSRRLSMRYFGQCPLLSVTLSECRLQFAGRTHSMWSSLLNDSCKW